MDWYLCAESREVLGPFPTTLVVRGIVAGKVPKNALVCATDGLGRWQSLEDVDDFADATEATRVFGLVPDASEGLEQSKPPARSVTIPSIPPPPPEGDAPQSQRRRSALPDDPGDEAERRWTEPMWLVEIDDMPRGPGTLLQILQQVQQGTFKPDTRTRRVDETAWRPAFEVLSELHMQTKPDSRPKPARAGEGLNAYVGKTLCGRYRLDRVIGSGGMGTVFEATNLKLGKRVAIKALDRAHQLSPNLRERLRREAEALASLDSPALVAVFDLDDDPQCGFFMVMELLKGEDLADVLKKGRLPVARAVAIALRVAKALARTHAAGIVHRDLKPANVFLVDSDEPTDERAPQVKVLDFGIAKVKERTTHERHDRARALTRAGVLLGTPQYMSPEQALGLRDVDARVDVWALGSILFEMVSGRAPYPECATYEQTILSIVRAPAARVRDVAPWVPADLAGVIDEMLEHDRAKRPADGGVAVEKLTSVSRDLPGKDIETTRPRAIAEAPARSRVTRRALGFSIIALVAVAILALVAAFAAGRRTGGTGNSAPAASPGAMTTPGS